jgi:hypothetical protein
MWWHFKYLCFKTFLIVSWGFNLMLIFLSNQGSEHSQLPHECNSQSGNALGNHWASSLAFSPICESVFHTLTHSRPHGPLYLTLYHGSNVKVVTLSPIRKNGQCHHWHLEFSCFLHITILWPSLNLLWIVIFPSNYFLLSNGHQLSTFMTRLCFKQI